MDPLEVEALRCKNQRFLFIVLCPGAWQINKVQYWSTMADVDGILVWILLGSVRKSSEYFQISNVQIASQLSRAWLQAKRERKHVHKIKFIDVSYPWILPSTTEATVVVVVAGFRKPQERKSRWFVIPKKNVANIWMGISTFWFRQKSCSSISFSDWLLKPRNMFLFFWYLNQK